MSKITTLLFDCDNTLVQSENLAFDGCASLVNEIVTAHSLPLPAYTGHSLQRQFVGQNFRGMLTNLFAEHGVAISQDEVEAYVKREEDVVIQQLEKSLVECDGATRELKRLATNPDLTLAVVSSSALRRVQVSLAKVNQARFFGDRVYSAANSLPVPTSKPDPAIYLHAMNVLGAAHAACVAVEDSKSGTTSAVRAGIKTIGYVGAYPEDEKEGMRGVLKEAGAVVVMDDWSEFEQCLANVA